MSNPTFAEFTLEVSPSLTDYVVGYRTAVSGGERRTLLQSTADLFAGSYFGSLTANALLLGQGNGTLGASDLTYSSPTLSVPDAFNISSAGSIRLSPNMTSGIGLAAAAGTVTRLRLFGPSVSTTPTDATWYTSANAGLFLGYSEGTGSGAGDWLYAHASDSTNGTNILYRKARGTLATPTLVNGNDVAGGFIASYYDGGSFRNTASIQFAAEATATSGNAPSKIDFATGETTGRSTAVSIRANGALRLGITSRTMAAWGVVGPVLNTVAGITFTDSSSSGTVATAVASGFAAPTFAASSSTTFTNAANLYIAGDVTAGTNVTLTNSYGLWNVGKTRLDGAVVMTPQALSGAGAVNVTSPSTFFTSTGGAQALTLANGIAGQMKTIVHVVDGGSGVLTPTSKIGFTTITFTNVGDSCTLQYTAQGWAIVGIFGAVAA